MREHLIAVTASAETAAIAGFAIVRGIWMPLIEKGSAVHLGTASSLYALMQQVGALALPQLMLVIGFTRSIRIFFFLHGFILMVCAILSGKSLLSFYICHAGAGFLSCTTDFLQQWGLLLSSTPEQQLTDFNLFQRSFLFGPVLGAGISSLYLSSVHLWKQDVTRSITTTGPDITSVRALFALLGLLVVWGGLLLFLVPLPSDRVVVRGYTYEDLMDALLQSSKTSECHEEELEEFDDASQRRSSLLGGVPNLHVEQPRRKLVREETGAGALRATKHNCREAQTETNEEGERLLCFCELISGEIGQKEEGLLHSYTDSVLPPSHTSLSCTDAKSVACSTSHRVAVLKELCRADESKPPAAKRISPGECSRKVSNRKKPKSNKPELVDTKQLEEPLDSVASPTRENTSVQTRPPASRGSTGGEKEAILRRMHGAS